MTATVDTLGPVTVRGFRFDWSAGVEEDPRVIPASVEVAFERVRNPEMGIDEWRWKARAEGELGFHVGTAEEGVAAVVMASVGWPPELSDSQWVVRAAEEAQTLAVTATEGEEL